MYFFLSYARSDDDPQVARFYHDLCSEVRVRAGLPSAQEVGFFDNESIELGAPWSIRLVSALAASRAFVALCSPRYFVSEPCGREWRIFADRQRERRHHSGESLAIIPVTWLPAARMPPVVTELQYSNAGLGEAYQQQGLRQLMRLRRYRDAYIRCLSVLATQIVEIAGTDLDHGDARRVTVAFSSVNSAFHDDHDLDVYHAGKADQPACGPSVDARRVRFVVAAPDRQEAATVRQDVSYYGDTMMDWAPYWPAMPTSLADYARRIAADHGFDSHAIGVDLFMRDHNGDSVPSEIVVLLIDGWASQIGDFRPALARLGEVLRQAGAPTSAAMIPSNHEDAETRASWGRLSEGLRSILLDGIIAGDAVTFRWAILSHRTFDEDLQVVLEVARNLLFRTVSSTAKHQGPDVKRPILEGP